MIKKATFKELSDKGKAVSIHKRSLQILVIEMFKVKIRESPSIMHDSNNFNLKKNRVFFFFLIGIHPMQG